MSYEFEVISKGPHTEQRVVIDLETFRQLGMPGYKENRVDLTIDLAELVDYDLVTLPIDSLLFSVALNVTQTIVAGGTSVKVGIGTSDTPALYGKTTDLILNSKINKIVNDIQEAETILQVSLVVTDGSAEGDTEVVSGKVRVVCVYYTSESLPSVV